MSSTTDPPTFKDFINSNKEKSYAIDLRKTHPHVYSILQEKKDILDNPDFEGEILEVQEFCKVAIKEQKGCIQRWLRGNFGIAKFIEQVPTYLVFIRVYFEYLELYGKAVTAINENEKNKILTFEGLFHDQTLIDDCIKVLREVEPPLIDIKDNWIGKLSGTICVWSDELQRQGIMKRPDDKTLSSLIKTKIKNLSIDESMFRKHQKRAEENFRLQLKSAISLIKKS